MQDPFLLCSLCKFRRQEHVSRLTLRVFVLLTATFFVPFDVLYINPSGRSVQINRQRASPTYTYRARRGDGSCFV